MADGAKMLLACCFVVMLNGGSVCDGDNGCGSVCRSGCG